MDATEKEVIFNFLVAYVRASWMYPVWDNDLKELLLKVRFFNTPIDNFIKIINEQTDNFANRMKEVYKDIRRDLERQITLDTSSMTTLIAKCDPRALDSYEVQVSIQTLIRGSHKNQIIEVLAEALANDKNNKLPSFWKNLYVFILQHHFFTKFPTGENHNQVWPKLDWSQKKTLFASQGQLNLLDTLAEHPDFTFVHSMIFNEPLPFDYLLKSMGKLVAFKSLKLPEDRLKFYLDRVLAKMPRAGVKISPEEMESLREFIGILKKYEQAIPSSDITEAVATLTSYLPKS